MKDQLKFFVRGAEGTYLKVGWFWSGPEGLTDCPSPVPTEMGRREKKRLT